MNFEILQKILMATKYVMYGLFTACVSFGTMLAADSNAQVKSVKEVDISISIQNANLKQIFKAVERKTDFNFIYSDEKIDTDLKMDLEIENGKVEDLLLKIAEEANLHFRQVNNNISVKQINRNSQNNIEIIIQGRIITGKVTSDDSDFD